MKNLIISTGRERGKFNLFLTKEGQVTILKSQAARFASEDEAAEFRAKHIKDLSNPAMWPVKAASEVAARPGTR
jgi:hypothetical protein